MDEYFARHPIFDKNTEVCGYHLVIGPGTSGIIFDTEGSADLVDIDDFSELSDRLRIFMDYSNDLTVEENRQIMSGEGAAPSVVIFSKNSAVKAENCEGIKSLGYQIAIHSTHILQNPALVEYADIIQMDFPAVSQTIQFSIIKQFKDKVAFMANRIETWDDYKKAGSMGYELFQGYFFLKPRDIQERRELKSLDKSLVSVLEELDSPGLSYARISLLIEHDLGLSYRLLRLVNSAYMAPKNKIKTISQAIVYLGTHELHQWIAMLMLGDIKNEQNSELIKTSLIRGKLMALLARKLRLAHSGSEPFFTGLFSLIDVILNKDMEELLIGLPLPDNVQSALSGKDNDLKRLLTFVTDYEQGRWHKVEGKYPAHQIKPENMVSLYIEALKWSKYGA